MKDETLEAAISYIRKTESEARRFQKELSKAKRNPFLLRRLLTWYCRVTGWEKFQLQKKTGLRIQSTALPSVRKEFL